MAGIGGPHFDLCCGRSLLVSEVWLRRVWVHPGSEDILFSEINHLNGMTWFQLLQIHCRHKNKIAGVICVPKICLW